MREIMFRGLGENGWVYGDLFSAWAVGGIHPRIHWVEGTTCFNQGVRPETVGQYAGRHDKNGTAIYCGDRLQWRHFGRDKVNGELLKTEVTWDTHHLQWYAAPNPLCWFTGKDEVEVIGNIWEEPGKEE